MFVKVGLIWNIHASKVLKNTVLHSLSFLSEIVIFCSKLADGKEKCMMMVNTGKKMASIFIAAAQNRKRRLVVMWKEIE